ncbi:MAG: SAM-dependent methyltransferase, partial [Deltaproteobacteria bacterium]|nr:SAM-dependent methyltransferase [Deltaproteobacteria bacterium]
MTVNPTKARHYLKNFKLEDLFIDELGWDRHAGELQVPVDGHTYRLRAVAEKRGAQVFVCEPGLDGKIPDRALRMKIERQLTKSAYEHLVVFADADRSVQIWQWVARQPGQPAAYREHHYHARSQSGDALIDKFSGIAFSLDDEQELTLTGVMRRLRDEFDRDRVTKKFYDRFQKEHHAFLAFIKGMGDKADQAWYASLMLNRLMFVYFIQRKGFLDGDTDYLRNRLKKVQASRGKGKFLSFYRYFLRRLFHEGLSQQPAQRAGDLEALVGTVPYLNGGIFEPHALEETYTNVDIRDEAFEKIFAFFDEYEWHLDTRPLANDRKINPDVLGYIFEKYINQKQMGAYYTKEDITEYISKNTIIPFLFDAAQKKCAVAFEPESAVWRLLPDDPDRYLYEPVRRGVIDGQGNEIPETKLPDFVQAGMNDPKARMFDRRYNLGEADLGDSEGRRLTLPTETWREYVSRRRRCLELREKLAKGEVQHINDLVTYNLDLRQFAEDVIATSEGPEL